MELIKHLLDFILHIDKHLIEIVSTYQSGTYFILFAIVFAETGLVITPFLPGDSLLFAAGALAAREDSGLSFFAIAIVLIIAAFFGDITNYRIGKILSKKVSEGNIRFINKDYIKKTEEFYAKHGGKTIIYARFVPIVRTFAPFVAGVGKMNFVKYISYGIIGSLTWVSIFLCAGYFFGNLPLVKKNFTLVALAIIGLSVLVPILIQFLKKKES